MMKRISALLLVLALCMGLSACGETGTDGSHSGNDSSRTDTGRDAAPGGEKNDEDETPPIEEEITVLTAEEAIAGSEMSRSGQCGENVTWAFYESGALVVSGTGAMWDWGNPQNTSPAPWKDFSDDITAVVVEEGVTRLGNNVFQRLYHMEHLTIPASVTDIGRMAAYNDNKLDQLYLPEGLETIGELAFGACNSLTQVFIPKSVTSIGGGAFSSCDVLKGIYVREGSESFVSRDGVLFRADGSTLVQFPTSRSGSYTVPDGVTVLGEGCFRGADKLTSVVLPQGLTTVGTDAFYWCSQLAEINLPGTVRVFGKTAFYDCSSLTAVIIPDGVTELPEDLFYSCPKLASVTIPKSVALIGSNAFSSCPSLADVYYGGSEADWSAIEIKSGNSCLDSAELHFSS